MWLTLAAMRNGIAILMASLCIILLGATSLGRMPIDLFPNINYPSLRIGTIYKGASAQDVERTVTYPIEKAVSAVANVRYSKGLSVDEVTRAVNDANFLLPAGDVKMGSFDYNVFTNNQFSVVEPMEDIVVRRSGTTPIRLRDVGRVEDSAETQVSIVRVNGERAVYLRVNKQPGANTVEVVDAVKATMPKLLGLPPGVDVRLSLDQSTYIRQSIENLWHEAAIGSVLAFLVILLFLSSLVSTFIIGIAIPLSLLLTMVAMYFLGQTLNIFTLGGLALAVGRLVDDSIVELENINRHLAMPGKPRRKAVLDAAREVAMPIFVSTITTIVVFLPTVFLEGQARLLFIPLTFTISFSLFASFLVSRTVTPLLCYHWLRGEHEIDHAQAGGPSGGLRAKLSAVFAWSSRMLQGLDTVYQRQLNWALDHRKALLGGILVLLASALIVLPWVGTEFFPESDEIQFIVRLRAPVGTR